VLVVLFVVLVLLVLVVLFVVLVLLLLLLGSASSPHADPKATRSERRRVVAVRFVMCFILNFWSK